MANIALSDRRSTHAQATWSATDIFGLTTAGDESKVMTLANLFTKGVTAITTTGLITGANFKTASAHAVAFNTTIGENVRNLQGTGRRNTMIGSEIATTSAVNTDGDDLIGSDNTLVGALIAQGLTVGKRNCVLGSYALQDCTEGCANIAIGYRALSDVVDGYNNVGIGDGTMMGTPSSYNNTNVGIEAGLSTGKRASEHVAVRDTTCYGYHAGYGKLGGFIDGVGNYSTWVGSGSGGGLRSDSTHENTTAVGCRAGAAGGANCLFLGLNAGSRSTADNEFYLDAIDRSSNANEKTQSMMYGTFGASAGTQFLTINALVSFGGESRHIDGYKAYFGTDKDASIYDSGTGFYIDPGAHILQVLGVTYFKNGNVRVTPDSGHAFMYVIGAGSSGAYMKSETGGDVYIYNVSNAPIYFGTNNALRMTIAAAGTVTVAGALVATGGFSIGAANRPVVATDATVATLISAMTTAGWIKNS